MYVCVVVFFFSSRRRHTRLVSDWSSDVCSSDLVKKRSGQPDDPDNGKQKQNARSHRNHESHSPSVALPRLRKLARQNRNKYDVVDAEHILKERQRDECEQTGRSKEYIHSDHSPLELSCYWALPHLK